jgi:hypothetical protein
MYAGSLVCCIQVCDTSLCWKFLCIVFDVTNMQRRVGIIKTITSEMQLEWSSVLTSYSKKLLQNNFLNVKIVYFHIDGLVSMGPWTFTLILNVLNIVLFVLLPSSCFMGFMAFSIRSKRFFFLPIKFIWSCYWISIASQEFIVVTTAFYCLSVFESSGLLLSQRQSSVHPRW